MKRVFLVGAFAIGLGAWAMPACTVTSIDLSQLPGFDAGLSFDASVDAPTPTGTAGVGAACTDESVCRAGLACTAGTCQPGHATATGSACTITDECATGDYCADQACAAAGEGASGASCASDGDCQAGLRCNLVGLATACQPEGTKDVGGACATSGDCYGGLSCVGNACAPTPSGTPIGASTWTGVTCPAETGPVTAYFEVPRNGAALEDYFRLPYPNDIRKKGASLDLSGFPTPGAGLLGYDLVDRWARYTEASATGYSVYPTVTFRFSGVIDGTSLDPKNVIYYADLTADAYLGYVWQLDSGRTAYVCPNALAIRPPTGAPLQPGHTYAVFFTTAVKAQDGTPVGVADDFEKVVAATNPGGDLAAAWTAYAPLRTWAAKHPFDLSTIADAAVFTVGQMDAIGKSLPSLVASANAPTASAWVSCATAKSPCPQADGDRACPATPNPDFDELHTLIHLPIFQKGTIPYEQPADGGDFVSAAPQQYIDVCAALTVPKGATGAIPALVYAHGTGGSFRSHATDGSGDRMAKQGIAVLGIDQVGHGTRRGSSTDSPDTIFFNLANPPAARGNVLQGAADQLSLVRFLKAGVSVDGVTLGGAIAYWGHSQGATEGAVSIPYTADVKGALFSGEGGSLIDSLLNKTSPVNLAALAPAILSESTENINAYHPVFSVFQNAIDPADPLDHAANATSGLLPQKHVFVPYGQADTYAPPITQLTYITAAGLWVAPTPASVTKPDTLNRAPEKTAVTANIHGFTAVTRQYPKPANDDGHFVVYDDPDCVKDADAFLKNALSGVAPTVPAP